MDGWLGWLVGLFLLDGKGLEDEMISVFEKNADFGAKYSKKVLKTGLFQACYRTETTTVICVSS
ncbi:MAG: hypothetical protein PUD35_07910 [Bacteroidales bacterium]|nr:hypothetical protein [Bacteroidales bacterium]